MRTKRMSLDIYTSYGRYVTTVSGVVEAAKWLKVSQPCVSRHLHGYSSRVGNYIVKEHKE